MTKSMARRLPPGSHGIPADVVARNQRERLVAAMAEVCAERGYAQASVALVAKRAGVSSVTFYKQFAGKRDCMLAANRQLLGRLLEEVDRASDPESTPEAKSRMAIHTALTLFAADPPSARLLTVEILAVGPEGAKRHDGMVEAFARRLRSDGDPADGAPVPNADWVRVAGMLALIGKLVMSDEAARLHELEDELVATISLQG
ncbi:MAG TPA: TetR/AcrR family transcriptional regulator [Solirubrobacterales bacterium]|nr:TetR/AcrR family transcriptional regulator [Solirubrobacterales bacterium]